MATCRYTRDPTSNMVESLMVSRKALQCRMEPMRAIKDTVVTSVVNRVKNFFMIKHKKCEQPKKPGQVRTFNSIEVQLLNGWRTTVFSALLYLTRLDISI